MQTQTTIVIVTIPGLLAVGWLVVLLLLLLGRIRGGRALFGWGVILAGLMILLTPETFYLYYALRDGVFRATAVDLVLLGASGFLGGAVAYFGAWYLRVVSTRAIAARGP